MKTAKVSFRSIALGLCLLAANAFAVSYTPQVASPQYGSYGYFYNNGTIYNVPAGANFEWDISASGDATAQILAGGGGLMVNQSVSNGIAYDLGNTTYADSISYQLSAQSSSGNDYATAVLFVGW